ncbi:MAG: hypothetical protein HZB83_01295 [Deltaproteobacteria bacterium]|nr:hypothetical protein [Deltaproteobacteria bacterium]
MLLEKFKGTFLVVKTFLWSIFGNDDDPVPPEWYHPTWPLWVRTVSWYVRNPFHNLTSYRWGLSGVQDKELKALFPGCVWALGGRKWQFAVWYYAGREYPFVSYRGKWVKAYIGWRAHSGGFGMALRFGKLKG